MNTTKIALYTDFDKALNISPSNAIISMFDHTDEQGILYIPEWPCDNNEGNQRLYKCRMNWNFVDLDDALYYYESFYEDFKKIASKWDEICASSAEKVLSKDLVRTWNKYIREFETGDMDMELISDISDRLETISLIKSIEAKVSAKAELSEEEISFYSEYKGTSISEEEKVLYDEYKEIIHDEAKHRVGDNFAAYDVIIRARRLCRLMSLDAPKVVINNEALLFAQAMVIHTYCKDMETVDDVE